jgi:hypothetical protein
MGITNASTFWQQVNLTYTQQINNESYLAQVTLLRDREYFTQNNVSKIGDTLVVNMPEIGLDNIAMEVIAIKPYKGIATKYTKGNTKYSQLDEINWDDKKYSPVTATFKRYAEIVNTYTFVNTKTNKVSKINSTPNHPFYVVNKKRYIPIEYITPDDILLSQNKQIVKLNCPNYSQTHSCRVRYNVDNKPTVVYNFEVYNKHRYYVSNDTLQSILVHNNYFDEFNQDFGNDIERTSWNIVNKVNQLIPHSGTRVLYQGGSVEDAKYIQNIIKKNRNSIRSSVDNDLIPENLSMNACLTGYGNCGEMAWATAYMLNANGIPNPELITYANHVIVRVPTNPSMYIDSWAKKMYYQPHLAENLPVYTFNGDGSPSILPYDSHISMIKQSLGISLQKDFWKYLSE